MTLAIRNTCARAGHGTAVMVGAVACAMAVSIAAPAAATPQRPAPSASRPSLSDVMLSLAAERRLALDMTELGVEVGGTFAFLRGSALAAQSDTAPTAPTAADPWLDLAVAGQLREAIRYALQPVEQCYTRLLKSAAPLKSGTIRMTLAVAPSGRVVQTTVEYDGLGQSALTECLVAAARQLRLRRAPGEALIVELPLTFRPGAAYAHLEPERTPRQWHFDGDRTRGAVLVAKRAPDATQRVHAAIVTSNVAAIAQADTAGAAAMPLAQDSAPPGVTATTALLATTARARTTPAVALPQTATRRVDAVFVLDATADRGTRTTATGFFVDADGRAVSASHALPSATSAQVRPRDGPALAVDTVLKRDRDRDLVLFRVRLEGRAATPLPLAHGPPPPGAEIHTLANVMGVGTAVPIDGKLAPAGTGTGNPVAAAPWPLVAPWLPRSPFLAVWAWLAPGASGAPLLNAAGHVFAVVSQSRTIGSDTRFFAAPLREFLRSAAIGERAPPEISAP